MLNNSRKYLILDASYSFRSVSLAAFVLLGFFVASGSNAASTTLYCRVLRSGNSDHTVYDMRWASSEDGGLGGRAGDILVYPELGEYSYAPATSSFVYWPKPYTQSTSPYLYSVVGNSSLNITVYNENQNEIPAILASINSLSREERANLNAIAVQYPEGGGVEVTFGYNRPGKLIGNGVSTFNSEGQLVLSYPNSTGLVPGYQPSVTGGYFPVWYDTSVVSSSGFALVLDSLNNTQSSNLSYDSDTGLYSFSTPDYSVQLSAINESIKSLPENRFLIDDIHLEIPTPEVNVNPEITVNPPEVNVNPEITVNPPEVNVSVETDLTELNDGISSVNESLDAIAESFYTPAIQADFSDIPLTEEENAAIQVAHGWETDLPVLGEAIDIGLDVLIGKIPQIEKKYDLLDTQLWGYEVKCDLNPYKETIMIFRAFFLLCELIWFFWVLWNDIHKALQV